MVSERPASILSKMYDNSSFIKIFEFAVSVILENKINDLRLVTLENKVLCHLRPYSPN